MALDPASTKTAPSQAQAPPPAPQPPQVLEEADTSASAAQAPCPGCGARRSFDDRFCEDCGRNFLAPAPAAAAWEAVVCADRGQFERFAVPGISFPADYLERRFRLEAAQVRIGRSRGLSGEPGPEIDLAGAPEDPAISRLHAVLERQPDGTYALRDLGSTNGTTVNDEPAPSGTAAPAPLAVGDHIRLGAWTRITIRAR